MREQSEGNRRRMAVAALLLAAGTAMACSDGAAARADSAGASASTVAENTPDNAKEPASRAPRLVILGTSLTAGLGLPPERAYPSVLQTLADSAGVPVRVVNAGLSGETSAGALRRAGWVLDQPADVVVLEVGANDGLRGVDPDSTFANLLGLIDSVRTHQPGARVALVQMEAPTNLGPQYTRAFHEAYVKAAAARQVPLLPFLLEGVAGVAALNQGDGIHPNAEGARRVAATMWAGIRPLLGPDSTGAGGAVQ